MNDEFAYVGKKSCGCLTFVVVDAPDCANTVAESIAEAVRAREVVERVSVPEVRQMKWKCLQHRPRTFEDLPSTAL